MEEVATRAAQRVHNGVGPRRQHGHGREVGGYWSMPPSFVVGLFVLLPLSSLPRPAMAQLPLAIDTTSPMAEEHLSAMLELKRALDTDGGILDSWNRSAPCGTWLGVTCNTNGLVTAIILSDFDSLHSDQTRMVATIPDTAVLLGRIPESIGELWSLTTLNLNGNDIFGSIPPSIGNLTKLVTLDLSFNKLTGSIPASLYNCTELVILDLHSNRLTGNISSSIGNLSRLYYLSLSDNDLTGRIPSDIGKLNNLGYLLLGANFLSESLPRELGNLTELVEMWLDANTFSGPVPDLRSLHNLRTLVLRYNVFEGSLPQINSTNIRDIDLTRNRFSGNLTFPDLPSLQRLALTENVFTGSIPDFASVDYPELETLDLSSNELTGEFPRGLSNVPTLRILNLSNNSLEGSLDPDMALLKALRVIDVGDNSLTGSIPPTFDTLTSLIVLNLENNKLSGSLDTVTILASKGTLVWVFLGNNSFEGAIDTSKIPANTALDLRLYGNPVCNATGSNQRSTATQCRSTSEIAYEAAPPCADLQCASPTSVNVATYATNGSCQCELPITAKVRLISPPFDVFSEETVHNLQEFMAEQINLTASQVFVSSAKDLGVLGHQVNLSFFPLPNAPFTEDSGQDIIRTLNDPRFPVSDFLGPFSRYAAVLPTLPNTASSPPPGAPPPPPLRLTSNEGLAVWAWGLLAAAMAVAAILGAFLVFFCCRPKKGKRQSSFALRVEKHFVKAISLEAIREATDDFSEDHKLGSGGFGTVYRGRSSEGEEWAVKRAKTVSMQGLQEFQNEVDVISRMSHANLVRLLGYCDEDNEQILVYEFAPNGTLKDLLRPKPGQEKLPLTFEQRLEVALGAAEGLRYLHTFAKPTIIHRDVKSENILLGANMQAKVADFGLLKDSAPSMTGDGEELVDPTHEATRVAGTPGYIDPEYYTTFRVTAKSDVYSFGVVLLELITGLPALVDDHESDEDEPTLTALASWVPKCLRTSSVHSIVDRRLGDGYPKPAMETFVSVAMNCLQRQAKHRPEMAEVASQLRAIKSSLQGAESPTNVDGETNDEENPASSLQASSSVGMDEILMYLSPTSTTYSNMMRAAPVSTVMGGR